MEIIIYILIAIILVTIGYMIYLIYQMGIIEGEIRGYEKCYNDCIRILKGDDKYES